MDLQKLQRFRAIGRSQNLSQASRELFLSESALSRTLKQVEEELGVSLFVRKGKRLELNQAGRILLDCAEKVETQIGLARREIAVMKSIQESIVRIYLEKPLGEAWMGKGPLASFLVSQPNVNVEISHQELPGSFSWDVKLYSTCEEPKDDRFVVAKESYIVLVSENTEKVASSELTLSELMQMRVIRFASTGNSVLIEDLLKNAAIKQFCYFDLETPFISDALSAVEQQRGVLILCESALEKNSKIAGVKALRLSGVPDRYVCWALSRTTENETPPSITSFIAHIENYFRG